MTKSCLCLTWKPLKMSSWNFIQILRIIRRRAEHKNHNPGMYSFEVIPLWTFINSGYIFLMPLEMQVQHYVPYLLSEFIPLCCTKTWLSVQNCTTPIGGRHQFSRRNQTLVSLLVLRAGYGIWLYKFLIIVYLFTFHPNIFSGNVF